MKKLFTYLLTAMMLVAVGCGEEFDDSLIWEKLYDHENRITKLEELCKQMNTNISSLQTVVNALQNNDYVTNIAPITEDGKVIGYTITFSKSGSITIYHGKDGKDGADGKDGENGYTPVIGVAKDTDDVYYWTLDGDWLLDKDGNKVKAEGIDGINGLTPKLKIENGYWFISYNNGSTWTKLGKATGENGANGKDGDSMFKEVTYDNNYVYITLTDGTNITVPRAPAKTILDVVFNEDGTATDEGIYGLDIQLMGEPTNTFVYHHKEWKKNVARFHNVRINSDITKHSYYKIDYSQNVEMMKTIADGFALEVVTLASCANWDWWLSPVATDAYRFLLKGARDNYAWNFTFNNSGSWFPDNINKINTTYDFNKYHHTVYMYDADNMQIQVWHNGTLLGMTENISEFKSGNLLTIGGYGNANDELFMQWNGEVAVVKMYDQVLEPAEIAEKFKGLKIPEGGSLAPAATYSEPLIDIKWNADKTATNAGTQTDLEVTAVPDDNVAVVNVDGFGYVADFNAMPNNYWNTSGFYQIDYSANEEFKNKLRDGFTFEFVCVVEGNPGAFFCRAAATDTFGCHLRCTGDGGMHYWQAYFNGNNGVWWNLGNTTDGYQNICVKDTGMNMESFGHMVCVYDPAIKKYYTYYNGHGNAGSGNVGEFNVGNFVGVPGMPGNPEGMQHGWPGKVAMVRMYDEPFNVEQILTRYNDLKPTIEKLNNVIAHP